MILIVIFILCISSIKAQNQIEFIGCKVEIYKHPMKTSNNKYAAYFENSETNDIGALTLNVGTKTLSLKFANNNGANFKFDKMKSSLTQKDAMYGKVFSTVYTGKCIENNEDCEFIIQKTDNLGCILTLRFYKLIDKDYGLNTWKQIIIFGSHGKCFDDKPKISNATEEATNKNAPVFSIPIKNDGEIKDKNLTKINFSTNLMQFTSKDQHPKLITDKQWKISITEISTI